MAFTKKLSLAVAAIGMAATSTGALAKPFATMTTETLNTAGSAQYNGRYVYDCSNVTVTPAVGLFGINGVDAIALPFIGDPVPGKCVQRELVDEHTPYFNSGKTGDFDPNGEPQYLAGGIIPEDDIIEEVYSHVENICKGGLTLLPGLIFTGVGENHDIENDPNNCAGLASLATREFIRSFREVVPAPMMSANLEYRQTVDHHTAFWGGMRWDVYHRYSKIPNMNYETYDYGADNPSPFASVYTSGDNNTPDPLAFNMVKHDFNYRYVEFGGVTTTPFFDGQVLMECTQDVVTGYLSLGSYDTTDYSISTHANGGSIAGCTLYLDGANHDVVANGIQAVGWTLDVVTSVDQIGTEYSCDDDSLDLAIDIIGADPEDHHLCD
ncbi:hypothetical protein A9Q99_20530 [Gammaproteobacteria bacterium 45_16_T64]|nr:hypothetical protein A9Q99_20530 [Gammaproteobacteria bacterium 45_16_T64]